MGRCISLSVAALHHDGKAGVCAALSTQGFKAGITQQICLGLVAGCHRKHSTSWSAQVGPDLVTYLRHPDWLSSRSQNNPASDIQPTLLSRSEGFRRYPTFLCYEKLSLLHDQKRVLFAWMLTGLPTTALAGSWHSRDPTARASPWTHTCESKSSC